MLPGVIAVKGLSPSQGWVVNTHPLVCKTQPTFMTGVSMSHSRLVHWVKR